MTAHHIAESQKLTADAEVDLFIMTLKNSTIYRFNNLHTLVYRGDTYEGLACQLTGDKRTADPEESRGILKIINPEGVFNVPAKNHLFDYATITRKRVLRANLEGNVNVSVTRTWFISRVRELIGGQSITFELRNLTEGASSSGFLIPNRTFTPPLFPIVSLA